MHFHVVLKIEHENDLKISQFRKRFSKHFLFIISPQIKLLSDRVFIYS